MDCVHCREQSKYKCPICSQPYCSVPCYKLHKEKKCEAPIQQPQITEEHSKPYDFPTEDTVPMQKLKLLDWASNTLDRKSYTGFYFKLSGTVISYECKKQRTIALSSTEAEYMEACKEAIYLRNLLCEIVGSCDYVIILYNDNQGAQKLSENPLFHKRTKHIDVRHHFIREVVANNLIKIVYLPTSEMPADLLTKGLTSIKHNYFVKKLEQSKEIRKCLENPHVRDILTLLDKSSHPDVLIDKYMQEPIFTEFVDACLSIVQPEE